MPARSSKARRKGTGKAAHKTKLAKTKVIHHHHRRYAGVKGQPKGTRERDRAAAEAKVAAKEPATQSGHTLTTSSYISLFS